MSQARRRGTEQGLGGEGFTGIFGTTVYGPSLLSSLGQDEGVYPGAVHCHRAWTQNRISVNNQREDMFLVDAAELVEFLRYVCPRLQERRELQVTTGRRHQENERLKRELQDARRRASEAEKEAEEANEELESWMVGNESLQEQNIKLRQELSEARQDSVEAQREANEARLEASSTQRNLRKTETAYEEAKKHFIMAPDLVPCLRSLTTEVKTLQEEVRMSGERTAEAVAQRPPDGRSEKTLNQMKRVLHDIGRYPRRRRKGKATDAADDGGGAIQRGRICYVCRCKGHLAENCPRVRTVGTTSAEPTMSDAEQRPAESSAEGASSGWTLFSALRRFTSGID